MLPFSSLCLISIVIFKQVYLKFSRFKAYFSPIGTYLTSIFILMNLSGGGSRPLDEKLVD